MSVGMVDANVATCLVAVSWSRGNRGDEYVWESLTEDDARSCLLDRAPLEVI